MDKPWMMEKGVGQSAQKNSGTFQKAAEELAHWLSSS